MAMQKNLKNILLWGSLLIMWTPLIYSNYAIFPYMSPKNFFFRLLLIALTGVFAAYILQKKKINFFNHKVFLAFLLFLAANLISATLAVNPYMAYYSSFERMGGWFTLLYLGLFFLIIINTFETKDDWLKLLRSSLLCSTVLSIYALISKYAFAVLPSTWPNDGATLGNIDFLGAYLMLSIFLGACLLYLEKNKYWKYYCGVALALNAIVLLLNAARAGIVGLVVFLLVMGIFYFFRAGNKMKIGLTVLFLVAVLFGVFAYGQRDSAWVKSVPFLSRFTQISLNDASVSNRLLIWNVSWQAFKDRPIFGYGLENAVYGINKHYDPKISEMWIDRSHNIIFDTLLAGGLVGLLAYLSIFTVAIYLLCGYLKRNYYLSAMIISALLGYFASNLFNFDIISTWLLFIILLAFAGQLMKKDASETAVPGAIIKYDFAFYGIIFAGLIWAAYFTVVKPAYAGYWGALATTFASSAPDKAVADLDRGVSLKTFGNRELVLQLSEVGQAVNKTDLDMLKKTEYFEVADKALMSYIKSDPHNIQARIFAALLYQSYFKVNSFYAGESITVLENNISDAPNRKELYNIMAQGYYLKGDYDKAIENLLASLAINNWDEDQYLNLINIYAQKKDLVSMDKYIGEFLTIKSISPDGYRRLGQYYFSVGKVDEAERVVRDLAIRADENYLPTRISLASIYEYRGEYDRAINYATEMIKLHPEWSETLNDYIVYLKEKQK